MSLYVIADIHAANGIAQLWTDHVKLPFQTGCLARNRLRYRIAVLDEPPRILFPKPVLNVDLRVRFCKPLISEVQNTAFFFPRLGAVHNARRQIEPVSEFVNKESSHGRVISTKSSRRRDLNAKVSTVAMAQRCDPATN